MPNRRRYYIVSIWQSSFWSWGRAVRILEGDRNDGGERGGLLRRRDSSLRFAAFRMTCGLGGKTGAHEGRPYRRSGGRGGWGQAIREDNGWGRLFVGNVGGDHPHPNLPPRGGRLGWGKGRGLEDGYGVYGGAGASYHDEGVDAHHEFVAALFGADLGQRLQQGVVEQGHSVGGDDGVDCVGEAVIVGGCVHHVPNEDRDVVVADEGEAGGVEAGAGIAAAPTAKSLGVGSRGRYRLPQRRPALILCPRPPGCPPTPSRGRALPG